ncbi:MAG: alpha/beta fold hydrolase [Proteobacteria bacterium]|nr:MAG: alpha/beta fold hydrolase [Pseudomonadota bacterium]
MAGLLIFLAVITAAALLALAGLHLGFRAPRVKGEGRLPGLGHAQATRITTARGKQLHAWFIPSAHATSTVVIQHGWGGNAEMMLPLAMPFIRAGFHILLADARNHGRSDADGHSSLPKFAEDLSACVGWLKTHHPAQARQLVLVGHSVGAAAALLVASRRSDISAVISLSAFAHPRWTMTRALRRWPLPEHVVRLALRYVEWVIGHRFDAIAPLATAGRLHCPLLLVHGSADTTVPVADAHAIARAHGAHLTLLEIPGATHDSVDRIETHAPALLGFLAQHGIRPAPA